MGFLSKIKNKMRKRVSKMPRRPGMISDMRYRGPRGNMGSDFRMPIKRGGFGGGFGGSLREAIRRLQEKRGGDMGMPRMPRIDDGRMRAMPIGLGDRLIDDGRMQMPQPIPERMPTDPSSYYNPTIFGQQMGNMDFSQMPEISPVDMSNLQMPTLPREISQMDIPQMPEGLPSMQDVQGGRDLQQDFPTQRRMMMAEGDEVFPDLTGDGKVTQADILKGRGVYAEGDEVMMMQGNEIENMLSGMESPMGEEEAMAELEQVQPEMEMIEQLVMMVAQMIQQGAGEEEVIGFLREQGLDDEDIGTVLQLVTEMSETEEMAEDEIGNQLSELG